MANDKKLFEKVYTADFVLLFVSFSIPFGWSMSGFPPCIELACACWLITLAVVLHCFWVWTKKWTPIFRLAIVVLIPIVVIGFSWYPVKKELILQHDPPKTAPHAQWYFKLDKIQCVPPAEHYRQIHSFRVQADINGVTYSFPSGLMYYVGLISNFDSVDCVPLRPDAEEYDIKFSLISAQNSFSDITSNVWKNDGREDIFKIDDLPIRKTNAISVIRIPDKQIKIIYEITTNL